MSKWHQRVILFLTLGVAVALAFTLGVGWSEAQRISATKPDDLDFASFWQVWNVIDERFVGDESKPKVSDQDKVYGAIEGLVHSLGDPYSEFLPPEDNKLFEEDIRGSFGGIGVEIGVREGRLMVIAPIEGSPAEQAGVRAGDAIVEIEGELVGKMTITEATNRIRGEVGTAVQISILRKGEKEKRELTIRRDLISVPTIETDKLGNDIFQIKLFNFGATSPKLFRDALKEFTQSGRRRLILDLRGNPGGYLDAAVSMASWFLPKGETVVIEDHGDESESKYYTSAGYDLMSTYPFQMVVLVDGGTASAAEILAGALSEHGKAKLVGTQTFGKGSVQELVSLSDDTSLKITIAHWLTPKGVSISSNGLKPDVVVDLPEDYDQGEVEDGPNDLILQQGIKTLISR